MLDIEKAPDKEHCFFTKDGKMLRNLVELKEELRIMPADVFNHHVNEDRNDFSNWVRGVFGRENLADRIANIATRGDLIELLERNTALTISMAMPKAGKEDIKKARRRMSKRKKPRKGAKKGPSVESKIKNKDLKGRIVRYRKTGKYRPSLIERTAVSEAEKLKKVLEKRKELREKEEEIKGKKEELKEKEEEIDIKEAIMQKKLADYLHIKKNDFLQGIVIGAIVILILVLLYFAVLKAF